MSVRVEIVPGPLDSSAPDPHANAGAILQFEGVVRPTEQSRPLHALEYEAYRPMADEMLHSLAEEILADHALTAVIVQHSIGSVPVGERSFRLLIASEHRAPSISAMALFIDRMKRDVPIWKHPVFASAVKGKA